MTVLGDYEKGNIPKSSKLMVPPWGFEPQTP